MKCKICGTFIHSCCKCGEDSGQGFSVCSFCWKMEGLDKICREFDINLSQLTYKKNQTILDEIEAKKRFMEASRGVLP